MRRLSGYRGRKVAPGVTTYTARKPMERYETETPWLTFRFAWSDGWTRVLGRGRVNYLCLICGKKEQLNFRLPRFGKVPEPAGGQHPTRHDIKARHNHAGQRGNPLTWALPLGNPAALRGTEAGVVDIIRDRVTPPEPK